MFNERSRSAAAFADESERVRENSSSRPWLRDKIQRAEKIHTAIGRVNNSGLASNERGNAWREALHLGSTDPKRVRQAESVFNQSLERFRSRGEEAVVNVRTLETTELSRVSFDMATDVAQGYISREAALAISKLQRGKLDENQIYELSSAFVAREKDESLADFDIRRRERIDELKQVSGFSEADTWALKRQVQDVLEIYTMLESVATKSGTWPKRGEDGQIRRSFINRGEVLNIAADVLKDIHACQNLNERKQQIEAGAEIPRQIRRLEEIAELVEERGDIKGATFDMFDTLVQWTSNDIERHELMWQAAPRVLAKYGIAITPEEFKAIRNPIWEGVKRPQWAKGQEFQADYALQLIVQDIAARKGKKLSPPEVSQIADDLEKAFIGVDADTAVPMPGAIDMLKALKEKGIKVAVISNHPFKTRSVEDLLQKYGLLKYIDTVVVSSEAGFLKSPNDPNATIFRTALEKLGLPPESVIHTGDNAEADQASPGHIGLKGIVYDNPFATQKTIQHLRQNPKTKEYREASLAAQREFSRLNAKSYYDANKSEFTPAELETYALRLYEISRDIYAPLMIKFAEDNLDKLSKDPGLLNLAVGRDGLASFLVQRKLIEMFPERYGNIDPKNVQFANLSRNSTLNSDPSLMRKFLEKTGFFAKPRINIIDNGIAGTIQNHLQNIFPERDISGNYLLSRKIRDDRYKDKKTGFIVESDSTNERDLKYNAGKAGTDPKLLGVFFSSSFVHNQEDMWNGIFESSTPMQTFDRPDASGRGQQEVKPGNVYRKMDYVPGNRDVVPGLNDNDNYLLLKKMALKGIIDGIHFYRRQTQLGANYSADTAVNNLGQWFEKADKQPGLDNTLVRAMVRKRN